MDDAAPRRVMFGAAVGAALRRHRRAAKLTQVHLADVAGVTQSAVSRWETGGVDVPVHTLDLVARLCGTTASAILADAEARCV